MTPATIHRIWIGNVARFHHNTDHRLRNGGDCTQSHQCRVAQLLALIFADATAEELRQAVLHDVAESWTGDVSYTAKQIEVIRSAHDWAETDINLRHGLPDYVSPRVKLCDNLDAILFAASRASDILYGQGWPEHIAATRRDAWALGVGPEVDGILLAGKVP